MDTKIRRIIFIVVESGMALFAIQLVRVVLYSLPMESVPAINGVNIVIGINQMFNVIIRFCSFPTSFVLLITFTWLGHRTNNYFGASRNEIVFQ